MNDFKGLSSDLPRKCAKLGIEKTAIPGGIITLNGDPFSLGSYQPGQEFTACDYDWPEGNMSMVTTGITRGPVLYLGKSCIEIASYEYSPEFQALARSRRFIYLSGRYAETKLIDYRRQDGTGVIEPVSLMTPLTVDATFRWKVVEKQAGHAPDSVLVHHQRIDGAYLVTIAKRTALCLRWLRMRTDPALGYEEADEVFVAVDSGLTVLARHYMGRGWPSFDTLNKNPKIDIDGRVLYLWYVRRVFR